MKTFIAALLTAFVMAGGMTIQARASTIPVPTPARSRRTSRSIFCGLEYGRGPQGTSFGQADLFYAFLPSGYATVSPHQTTTCTGYWAFFTTPATIPLNPTAYGPTQVCPLQAGWTMVGNPFAGDALLPNGVTGYYWNRNRMAYDTVSKIPMGAAVWIFSDAASSVLLTFTPAPTVASNTLFLYLPLTQSSFSIHVGDSVKLVVPAGTPVNAIVTPPGLLIPDTGGTTLKLDCIGDPACAITPATQFFVWHAVAPGIVYITITPLCLNVAPACGLPAQQVQIIISA